MGTARLTFMFRPPARRGGERGFALVITVTLVAFLVLVLVAFSTFTRVETSVASNSRHLSLARQNALFGLNVAFGRLQETAGPDQRVTATADLVAGRDDSKRHWTGVWNSDAAHADYGANIAWLVSGLPASGVDGVEESLPASSDGGVVILVGAGAVGGMADVVAVPTQPINAAELPGLGGGGVVGSFGYWVGDEGVKANVTLADPWAGSETEPERRYSFVSAQRAGVELVEASAGVTLEGVWTPDRRQLGRMLTLDQMPFVSADQTVLSDARKNRFHDLTVGSASLFVDVAKGGLKKDLTNWLSAGTAPAGAREQDSAPMISTLEGSDHGLPRWGLVRSYAGLVDDGGAAFAPREQTAQVHGLHPVVTYFRLGIAVSCEGPDEPLRIHFYPTLVLWNPYSVPLAHVDPDTGVSVRYEIAFSIRGSGSRLRFRVGGPEGDEKALLSMNKASVDDSEAGNRYFRFEVAPGESIPPGQSRVFTLADDADYTPGQNTLVDGADSGASVVMFGETLSADDIAAGINRGTMAGNTMDLVLRLKPSASDPAPSGYGPLVGELQAARRTGLTDSGNLAAIAKDQLVRPVPAMAPLAPDMHFFLLANMSSNGQRRLRWIAQQNYRAPFIPRPDIDDNSFHTVYDSGSRVNPGTPAFANFGTRASAGVAVQEANATDLVLAELPHRGMPFFSLAQLQHANFGTTSHYPTYAVGNSLAPPFLPLGDTAISPGTNAGSFTRFHDISHLLNRELWDRYFFSTVPVSLSASNIVDPDYHLPNARHIIRRQGAAPAANALRGVAAFDTAAAHLVLNGGFNVNSTSVQAWRALLASHLGQDPDPNDATKRHPFSRFARPLPTAAPNHAWEGYRILSDEQIKRLASHIVTEVRGRGPFLSLGDFVNRRLQARGSDLGDHQRIKGALQAAIDATDTDAGPDAAPINTDDVFKANLVPSSVGISGYGQAQFQGGATLQAPYSSRAAFAPGYLTQADLLTALGPVLTARSDTFLIRAYGEVSNPVTGDIEGKAWCEAVVQRQPDYVGSSADAWTIPAAGSDAERFGRRFQVVGFRWLTPTDI